MHPKKHFYNVLNFIEIGLQMAENELSGLMCFVFASTVILLDIASLAGKMVTVFELMLPAKCGSFMFYRSFTCCELDHISKLIRH